MSLRLRLLAAFAYVLVLVLVALALPLSLNLSRRVDAEVKAQAAGEAHLVAASVSGQPRQPGGARQSRDEGVRRGRRPGHSRRRDGVLLADSAGTAPGASIRKPPGDLDRPGDGTADPGRRRSETLDEQLLYTAVPVIHQAQRIGAVRVTQSVEAIDGKVRRDILTLAGIGLVALRWVSCSRGSSRDRCRDRFGHWHAPRSGSPAATSTHAPRSTARRSSARSRSRSTT